ncbi:MAG: DUF1549 and DUF1553 domain-containing protein [Gemmataceae bacterium]
MHFSRWLPAVAAVLFGLGTLLAADDTKKPETPADAKIAARKAKMEARLKAEAEAKAKEEAEAKAKAEAEAKAKEAAKARPPAALNRDTLFLTQTIDREITGRLAAEKLPASPKADDAEFLRRIYLDLTGVIPPADTAKEFLDNADPKKREALIDELLMSPAFGKHMADVWAGLLFQRVTDNRAIKFDPLKEWLEERFNAGRGWGEVVGELLTATGTQEDNGAATYFLAQLSADKLVDSTSKLFLGIKLECTQCHNHPFTGWKQTDYWGMAAFFMKVRIQGNTKNGNNGPPGVSEGGKGRQRNLPESAKMLPPKFFHGEQPKVTDADPLRPVLAKWLTSPDNKYFGRAFANRVWGQLFGSGIVNPIDDMHEERPVSHPELLAELAKQFAARKFDVKYLFRAICNSEAYQRTSRPVPGNEKDATLFSHMNLKVLTPGQLYDSLVAVLGEPGRGAGKGMGGGNGKRGPQTPRDQFVNFFAGDENAKATDYEAGIPQALRLMNSRETRLAPQAAREIAKGLSKDAAIEKLYLTTLARRPSAAEAKRMTEYVTHSASHDAGYGDVLWALLNSSEFAMNR